MYACIKDTCRCTFCDGKRWNAVPEVISQNDATRNVVPEPSFPRIAITNPRPWPNFGTHYAFRNNFLRKIALRRSMYVCELFARPLKYKRIACNTYVHYKNCPTTRYEGACAERTYSSYSFSTSALDMGEWSASRPGRALAPGKGASVPIVQGAGWAPEPVWIQKLEEKYFRLCRG
jgi:hypothetical protein